LGFQDLLSRIRVQVRRNELKGLVTVQAGVELQEFVRDSAPEAGQGLLKAEQVLRPTSVPSTSMPPAPVFEPVVCPGA
jgi:hypothetical protein